MYSSVLSSQPNSRLSQLNSSGYPTHPSQFTVRAFKTPTFGSYFTTPKHDLAYHSVPSSDYYPTSRFEDQPSRFPPPTEPQRTAQYPPNIRTNLTGRDYDPRPADIKSNYSIHKGNADDTYVYEQSDTYSVSEFDDTTTNASYSPALSTDSLTAMKSPLPSPLTEQDSTTTTRRNSMSVPVPPLSVGSGTDSMQGHSTIPIQLPPSAATSSHSSDIRPPSSFPPPPAPSSGYTWHHAIPTIAPSEADTEDVSLEARMNAEYNAAPTGSYYSSSPESTATLRAVPVSLGPDRSMSQYTPPNVVRPESARPYVPNAIVEATPDVQTSIRGPLPTVSRSPTESSSVIVESLEEGRASSYGHRRGSRVAAEAEQFLPPLENDVWLGSRERRDSVSYQRVPPPEVRREYSTSTTTRSTVSSTRATYQSSPPRTSIYASGVGGETSTPAPPLPPPSSRPRADSRASYSVRQDGSRRSPETRDVNPIRSSPPRQEDSKLNTSPKRRQDGSLHPPVAEPVQTARAATKYPHFSSNPEVQPPARPPEPYGQRSTDNHGVLRTERRASPPAGPPGSSYRPQSTAPPDPYRSQSAVPAENAHRSIYSSEAPYPPAPTPSNVTYHPRNTTPPGTQHHHSQVTVPPSDDPYRVSAPPNPYHPQSGTLAGVTFRSQSSAPPSGSHHPTGNSDASRAQSRTPPGSIHHFPGSTSEHLHHSSGPTRPPAGHADPGYTQQAAMPPGSFQTQPDTRPATRPRTNSGSWSRNATTTTIPNTTKPPSPPRPPQTPAPRLGSRPASPVSEVHRGQPIARDVESRRTSIYATAAQPTSQENEIQRDPRGPPPSYSTVLTGSPGEIHLSLRDVHTSSRDARSSSKHTRDSDYPEKPPKAKPALRIRNPSPLESVSEAIATPHIPFPAPKHRHSDGERLPNPPYGSTNVDRRSTLAHEKMGHMNGQLTQLPHGVPEQPQRRFSDGDHPDEPSFSINTGRSSAPLTRSVRWNENLICPSPVLPSRPKGWFNRRGDQLWTNEGGYKPAAPGQEYPPEFDDYPENGQGWMNEEGVRIDLDHRLIPKVPLRSALKQPKALS